MKLSYEVLNGSDGTCMNSFVDAVRAGEFVMFNYHYGEKFKDFFKKVTYVDDKDRLNVKKFDLSIYYQKLSLEEVEQCFNEVFEYRKQELGFLLKENEISFDKLNDLDKLRYSLLYHYGDKLGGYMQISALNIKELIAINKVFNDITVEQNKKLSK